MLDWIVWGLLGGTHIAWVIGIMKFRYAFPFTMIILILYVWYQYPGLYWWLTEIQYKT